MFDLVAFNPWLVLSNLLLALFMLWIIFPAFDIDRYIPRERIWITTFLLFIFCEFSFWGSDWFHLYDTYDKIMNETAPVENFYYWIANNLAPNDYFLFRLIVWGSALAVLLHLFKRTNVDYALTLAIFTGVTLIWYSYGRVSLSMATAFLGLSLIYNPIFSKNQLSETIFEENDDIFESISIPNTRMLSLLLGVTLTIVAIYLHHSGIYATVICALVLASGFFSRRYIILGLVAFSLVLLANPDIVMSFLLTEIQTDSQDISDAITRSQQYMESTNKFEGATYTLGQILEKTPYFMLAGSSFILWNEDIPSEIRAFMRAIFMIVLSSTLLYFLGGMNMQVIYDRFIKFCMIPSTLVLSYMLSVGFMPKWHKTILALGIGSTIFQLTYMWYCAIASNPIN